MIGATSLFQIQSKHPAVQTFPSLIVWSHASGVWVFSFLIYFICSLSSTTSQLTNFLVHWTMAMVLSSIIPIWVWSNRTGLWSETNMTEIKHQDAHASKLHAIGTGSSTTHICYISGVTRAAHDHYYNFGRA